MSEKRRGKIRERGRGKVEGRRGKEEEWGKQGKGDGGDGRKEGVGEGGGGGKGEEGREEKRTNDSREEENDWTEGEDRTDGRTRSPNDWDGAKGQGDKYVKERILALRVENPGQYQNVSVVRTNSMKYIPNYFEKGQLSKMFFLFPDPHFKEKNHRRRVISPHLLDEYAYALCIGGIIYTITDVEELGEWMKACLEGHPMFEAVRDEELEADPVVKLLSSATEEGQKVARNGGQTFQAVYKRVVPSL
ncbi:hypothetical protein RHMOL_Rhmol02G0136800 [Rhododendron molle]|uniref:Uncharacterized protein n=1 Tax=Rhododendron molle TaxID=49168 RepID=A0ACC0PPK7_RHOML|nr:hypothetical protein RHMOL_Rhmol02G0136800 [Rhododendron molle]